MDERKKAEPYASGYDMWRGYAADYGDITARIICCRYLNMQATIENAEERVFCRQLREAMEDAPNLTGVSVYLYNERFAELRGELELYAASEKANRLCAEDIDAAIHASSYGDGRCEFHYAMTALVERYGLERVKLVLAAEAGWLGMVGRVSEDVRQWTNSFKLGDHFYGGYHLRTRPEILEGLIAEIRQAAEKQLQPPDRGAKEDKMADDTQNTTETQKEKPFIRFIDSDYRELFRIPDGGNIRITYPPDDGRGTIVRACKFLDEYHTRIGSSDYHICEWAERMEALGARYEPEVQLLGAELEPFTAGDEKFYTFNREEGNACAGHISGGFGNDGERFSQSWRGRDSAAATSGLQADLQAAVYALRQTVLKDVTAMVDYCRSHPEALIERAGDFERYGFKLETEGHQYYISCIPQAQGKSPQDARFIIYAYDRVAEYALEAAPKSANTSEATEKYEFTGETLNIESANWEPVFDGADMLIQGSGELVYGHTLRQIRALRDFGDVKAGDIGGWVESRENLSQEGTAWVYEQAKVYGGAEVFGNAKISGQAEVTHRAKVYGGAEVSGNSRVSDSAEVFGIAEISGDARVYGDFTKIYDSAKIFGNGHVYSNCDGDEKTYGEVRLCGSVEVTGDYYDMARMGLIHDNEPRKNDNPPLERRDGYTSVLTAIEEDKKAPKPTRKTKAPGKHKNSDDAEL